MKRYVVYQVDAFTKTPFEGNPAGVVLDATGLDDVRMQRVARELNNSETSFLFPPDGADCDGVIRYFTPRTEVPTCGHATVAAMYARAVEEGLGSCTFRMRTRIGVLPFDIVRSAGDYHVVMTQGRPEFGAVLEGERRERVLAGLGLRAGDLDERCPMQIASTGHSKVMIGIRSRATLHALTPDFGALAALSPGVGSNGYFVFTLDAEPGGVLAHGRMFAPAIGVNEDPVTGNANGPLGAYLVHHGLAGVRDGDFALRAKQGEAMGRPGVIDVRVKVEAGRPVRVQIGGEAVVVFRTEIALGEAAR